jgi:thiamine biosynthesis protein ThiS
VRIGFKLYTSLAAFLPPEARRSNRIDLEVEPGTTVLKVILAQAVPPERCSLVLVNGHFVPEKERGERELQEGDVLAIWPPVGGG